MCVGTTRARVRWAGDVLPFRTARLLRLVHVHLRLLFVRVVEVYRARCAVQIRARALQPREPLFLHLLALRRRECSYTCQS